MASKFFNKPQLGQTQLEQAERTNLTGVDNEANAQAAQAERSLELLSGLTKGVANIGTAIAGKYQDNINAKNRLESGKELPSYQQRVEQELAAIPNLEAFSRQDMDAKLREINESFMNNYDGKPYNKQLRDDINKLQGNIIGQMLTSRDRLHVQKVTDATSEEASSLGQQYGAGTLDEDGLMLAIDSLLDESTIAHQVPTSSELELSEDAREKYKTLTKRQAIDSVLKGLMVQTGRPANSRVADFIGSKSFRKSLGIGDTDSEYNKLVDFAKKKGIKADKFKYSNDLDSLKEKLYGATNLGLAVDIDMKVKEFRSSGNQLTAKDEHRLRKEFKAENNLLGNSDAYVSQLLVGRDTTANMTGKQKQAIYNRAFTNILDITAQGASIGNISGSLGIAENQKAFKDYIQSGGKIPKAVIGLFDVPAGADVDKWNEANAAIMSMEAASAGSGFSIESIIGVNQVSKIRGLSRLLNDDKLDEATKKTAIEAFHTRSATFNSKGYLQGTVNTRLDPTWLDEVSKDAPWTTDDFISSRQNADEIAGNYQAYRLAGHDDSKARELALELFEESNTNFEMPNGGEIAIPLEHKYLNNESILAFSKDSNRFPSLKLQRDDLEILTGEGWISEWRLDRNISIQKSYNFAKTGKYDMMFDGKLVKDSSFTYDELEEYISTLDHKQRSKITGVKSERPFKEVEKEALSNRKRNIEDDASTHRRMQHIFDLTI